MQEFTANLYSRAKNFLDAAIYNMKGGYYDVSAILFSRAVYLVLVAKLLDSGVEIPWYLDFSGLFRLLQKKLKIEVNKEFPKLLDTIRINDCYFTPVEINKEEIEELHKAVEELLNKLNII
ncbi:HEPN domain-containing protein [Acidianus sp. HS-5]|uniref:HEPN domain-containing protein n=1 Tax=Acidianus sp. HS-5 TaxID=2886040 RepID=UPI001F1C1C57|nr:HEPN domain-containing protein [Acidianus sp. HS-5]BDC17204.1 HEPN domain-containing protein [Acidianus sp. HS-5]